MEDHTFYLAQKIKARKCECRVREGEVRFSLPLKCEHLQVALLWISIQFKIFYLFPRRGDFKTTEKKRLAISSHLIQSHRQNNTIVCIHILITHAHTHEYIHTDIVLACMLSLRQKRGSIQNSKKSWVSGKCNIRDCTFPSNCCW